MTNIMARTEWIRNHHASDVANRIWRYYAIVRQTHCAPRLVGSLVAKFIKPIDAPSSAPPIGSMTLEFADLADALSCHFSYQTSNHHEARSHDEHINTDC